MARYCTGKSSWISFDLLAGLELSSGPALPRRSQTSNEVHFHSSAFAPTCPCLVASVKCVSRSAVHSPAHQNSAGTNYTLLQIGHLPSAYSTTARTSSLGATRRTADGTYRCLAQTVVWALFLPVPSPGHSRTLSCPRASSPGSQSYTSRIEKSSCSLLRHPACCSA